MKIESTGKLDRSDIKVLLPTWRPEEMQDMKFISHCKGQEKHILSTGN